ncbi:MAG: hypothetical protein L0Z62_16625 [Gemmataceae bacterium]|nr:hypothetical protein [Gemmataceae bacterium]
MPLFCTCLQGHRWELDALPPEGEAAVRCPECGGPVAASSSGEPAAPVEPFDPAALALDPIKHGVSVVEEPPPRAAVPAPAEDRGPARPLPVARRPAPDPRRPAPRSSSGGLVTAVILLGVFALLLLIGGIALFLWYQGAVAREREMAAQNEMRMRMEAERARQMEMERARAEQQQRRQAEDARNLAEMRVRQLDQERQEARRREEGLKATLYAQGIALADLELRARNMPAALTHLRESPAEARGWEWRYLDRLARSDHALFTPHGGSSVLRAVFSPDGRHLLSGGTDRNGRLSDSVTGATLATLTGHKAPVRAVAYRPDGKVLATGGNRVIVRDAATGQPLVTLAGHKSGGTQSLAFSPDGKRLASVGFDRMVRIWDPESGKEVQTLRGHTGALYSVAYSPDGNLLASAGGGKAGDSVRSEVKVWDTRTGEELLSLLEPGGGILGVAFHPDGKRLATAAYSRGVKVWDVTARDEKPVPLLSFPAQVKGWCNCAFSPDGKLLATGGPGGPIALRDADSGRPVQTLMGLVAPVAHLAFSPDGKRLAVCRSGTSTLVVYDLGEPRLARRLEGQAAAPWSLAFSPDGKRLAGVGKDNAVLIWDALTGKQAQTLRGHTRPLQRLAFPTQRWVVSVGASSKQEEDAEVKVWDALAGKELHTLKGHPGGVGSIVFHPPGNRLILCSPGRQPLVYDCSTGQQANLGDVLGKDWQNLDMACLALSPDGGRVATSSRRPDLAGWAAIRERSTNQVLRQVRGHNTAIGVLAFSSDGKTLMVSHVDGRFLLWETDSAREVMDLGGSALYPHSRAFSPDGRRGVWFAGDETVQLWGTQPRPNRHLLTLRGHQSQLGGVTFSPDGHLIAAVGRDGTVLVWDGRPWTGRP